VKGITLVTLAITDPIMVDTVDRIMEVTRAQSRSRLAIGLITFAAPVITQATRITAGGQDIGRGGMVSESGSTATMLSEGTDGIVFPGNRYSNDWLSKAPARQTETQRCNEAT
jgi:hypothetical protein